MLRCSIFFSAKLLKNSSDNSKISINMTEYFYINKAKGVHEEVDIEDIKAEISKLNPKARKFIDVLKGDFLDGTVPKDHGKPRTIIIRASLIFDDQLRRQTLDEEAKKLGDKGHSPWSGVNLRLKMHHSVGEVTKTYIFPVVNRSTVYHLLHRHALR